MPFGNLAINIFKLFGRVDCGERDLSTCFFMFTLELLMLLFLIFAPLALDFVDRNKNRSGLGTMAYRPDFDHSPLRRPRLAPILELHGTFAVMPYLMSRAVHKEWLGTYGCE